MKTILITTISISTCWYFFYHKSQIKHFNELKLKSDTIILLNNELFVKDSVVINCDEFFPNNKMKDIVNFKKRYFQTK